MNELSTVVIKSRKEKHRIVFDVYIDGKLIGVGHTYAGACERLEAVYLAACEESNVRP